MRKITSQQFLCRKANNYVENLDDNFLNLYSLYHLLLTKYVNKLFSLSEVDKNISESNLKYVSVSEDKMDIYQWLSSEELKYFYIRNNLHLQRLSNEELKFLQQKLLDKNEQLDELTEKFIYSTLEKVISENTYRDDAISFFGPDNYKYIAPSNSLVIGFRYDEFNNNGLSDEEWDIQHELKQNDIFQKIIQLKTKIKLYDIMPVTLIEYNDFSVQNKNIFEKNFTNKM